MNMKFKMFGVLTLAAVLLTACGEKPAAAPPQEEPPAQQDTVNGSGQGSNKPSGSVTNGASQPIEQTAPGQTQGGVKETPEASQTPAQEAKTALIKLYYTDSEVTVLQEADQEITYKDETDKYIKAFEALQESDSDELVPLWRKGISLNSADFKDGELTLDITKSPEANLGSGGELYALEALEKTFFQFDEVESIELLVEGQKVESLMGHAELPHPIRR